MLPGLVGESDPADFHILSCRVKCFNLDMILSYPLTSRRFARRFRALDMSKTTALPWQALGAVKRQF